MADDLRDLEIREIYKQIVVTEGSRSVTIKHDYAGHITVYRPERDHFADSKPGGAVITPGYINASSWVTGGISPKNLKDVHTAMLVQLRIIDMALDKLNEYNSVLPEWEPIHNPWDAQDSLKNARHSMETLRTELEQIKKSRKRPQKGKGEI